MKKYIKSNSRIIPNNSNEFKEYLKTELLDAALSYDRFEEYPDMIEEFGPSLVCPKDYTSVHVKDYEYVDGAGKKYPGLEVEFRSEISYEEMIKVLVHALDPIVQKYDEDAYFDLWDACIAKAYIYFS